MDLATIDPTRLGYDPLIYDGQNLYEPVKQAQPYYPNMYFGNALLRRPVQQHYKATLDNITNGMRITPVSFASREATIVSINTTFKQVVVRFPIAHGAPAGMHIVMTRVLSPAPLNEGVHGFVLAPPALDETKVGPFVGYTNADGVLSWTNGFFGSREPHEMTICYGGINDLVFAVGEKLLVSFVPPRSWGVDLTPNVI